MHLFSYSKAVQPASPLASPPPVSDLQFHSQSASIDVYFGSQHTAFDVARIELTVRCITRTGDHTVDSTRFVFRRESPDLKDLNQSVLGHLEVLVSKKIPITQKMISLSSLERLIADGSGSNGMPIGFSLERIEPQHPYEKLKARRFDPLVWSLASPRRVIDFLVGAIDEVVYFKNRGETSVLYCRPEPGEPSRYAVIFEYGEPRTLADFTHYELDPTEAAAVLGKVGAYFRQGGSARILEFLGRDITIAARKKTPLGGTLLVEKDSEPSTEGGVVLYIKGAASTAMHPVANSSVVFEYSFPAASGTTPIDNARTFAIGSRTRTDQVFAGAPSDKDASAFVDGLLDLGSDVRLVRADPAAFPSVIWKTVHLLRQESSGYGHEAQINFGISPGFAQYLHITNFDLLARFIAQKRYYFTVQNPRAESDEIAAIIVDAVDENDISFQMIDRYGRSCTGHLRYSGRARFEDFKPDEAILKILRAYLEKPSSVFRVCKEERVILHFPKKDGTVQTQFFDNDPIGRCLYDFHCAKSEVEGFRDPESALAERNSDVFVPLNAIISLGKGKYEARESLTVGIHQIGLTILQDGQELFICVYDQTRNFNLSYSGSVVSILADETEGLLYALAQHLLDINQNAGLSETIPAIVHQVFTPSPYPFYQNIGRFDDSSFLRGLWWLTGNYGTNHSVRMTP